MTDPNNSPWGQPPPGPGRPPPYGQSPYGEPQHPQYPYGYGQAPPPPPYPYGGYPQPGAGTNSMAIASLILAFFCSLAGLICGIVALNQIKQRPQEGQGLAIAGIVISVLGILAAISFFAFGLWVTNR